MPRVRTHYDNLKVARDAPPEVIGAAFLALSGKYGPEAKHQDMYGDEIYLIIRRSYRVLSDPAKRAAHDRWVAEMESGQEPAAGSEAASVPPVGASHAADGGPRYSAIAVEMRPDVGTRFIIGAIVIVFVFIAVMAVSLDRSPSTAPAAASSSHVEQGAARQTLGQPTPAEPTHVSATAVAEQPQIATVRKSVPVYERPDLAPNGLPWPTESGYVGDAPKATGHCVLTIDNSRNDFDVLVRIHHLAIDYDVVANTLFVRGRGQFKMEGMKPGTYDIRFRNLDSGTVSKAPSFVLQESTEDVPSDGGTIHRTHYSVARQTLYTVVNGNTHLEVIRPEDF